ncbi:beta-d-xylosidase 1 [Plakobranchus ocellatus]|uniref:Beta-d-xylosidase 1 n=1 Tax=Plakobranchus ocellatus TaxID=259542 RepID=A0AAV4CS24_9GAST|nr:beta-d-xylosidase 1 [Plakobranchus ocellatus]
MTCFYISCVITIVTIFVSAVFCSDALNFKTNNRTEDHYKAAVSEIEESYSKFSQIHGSFGQYPFWNTNLSWQERVEDLVSRLTLEEVQLQMARGGTGPYSTPAPPIMRLGIVPYVWNSKCQCGDQGAKENATAFPQSIGLAASFSPQLLFDVATVASVETRGKHNDFVRRGVYATNTGASCFSPVINVVRDPHWGRIQETYGEDPFMSGELAAAFLNGLHGDDGRYVRVTGGCRHLDAYSGPENIPASRLSFDAKVSDYDLYMTYLPGFKRCVEAGTYSIMCSYNSVNGVPACANQRLLTDILRKSWKFNGYVVSDEQALEYIVSEHKYLNNYLDVAAASVNAGVNLELSADMPQPVFLSILDAVKQGKVNESLVRDRVKPLFYTRMRLGQFDPPARNQYSRLSNLDVVTPAHFAMAVDAAKKSFVLLKNDNSVLPLNPSKFKTVAILGPMADNYQEMFGSLPPLQNRVFAKTPLEGLREAFPGIRYKPVCEGQTLCTKYSRGAVKKLVTGTDLIIAVFGTGPAVEAEGNDRSNLNFPGMQLQFIEDILENGGTAKIVLILMSAGPLNVTLLDADSRVSAILECFFPGQATGDAIREVLINKGNNSSPAGRLPVTWPLYASQVPPITNYSMVNRTYRYMQSSPLYPFGFGLSYTKFIYESLIAVEKVKATENLMFEVTLKNVGAYDADEVIQCYISWDNPDLPVPIRQLAHFARVHLKQGEELRHTAEISWKRWAFWGRKRWFVKQGSMRLTCGGQQPNQTKTANSNVVTVTFHIIDSASVADTL